MHTVPHSQLTFEWHQTFLQQLLQLEVGHHTTRSHHRKHDVGEAELLGDVVDEAGQEIGDDDDDRFG